MGKLVGLLNELETKCHKLEKENEELKQKIDFYKYFQKDARELEREMSDCDKRLSIMFMLMWIIQTVV